MRLPVTKDLLSGLVYIAVGTLTVSIAAGYGVGTVMRIGPGAFPILIGGLLTIVGFALALRGLYRPAASDHVASWEIRPLLFVTLSIIVFSLTIGSWGLIPAIIAIVAFSYPASREASPLELALIAVVLCAFSIVVFVYGLNIPMKIGPW